MAQQVVALTGDEQQLIKSLDKVIAKQLEYERKLRDSEDAGREAGAAVGGAFDKAGRDAQRQMKDVLKELRALGPEGREAAEQLKRELVAAGELAERSMEDIVTELEKVSPAAAAAGRKIKTAMDQSAEKGKESFAGFRTAAVSELAAVAAGFTGINEAISFIDESLQHQIDLMEQAAEIQTGVARAQQGSLKNLAALAPEERKELLAQAPEIAVNATFGDAEAIVAALGAVASTGEGDADKIIDAVTATAKLNRLTTEELAVEAPAAAAIANQAGISVREALALQTTTGTQARIEDPKLLLKSLPAAIGAITNTVQGQNRQEAAEQAAAFYAQVTQGGNDVVGRSSTTFATDFSARLQKLFTEMDRSQIEARSKIELIDRKIEKGSDTELDRLKRSEAQEFLKATANLDDPASFFGRLQAVQGSKALQKQLVGEGFGEKQFQTFLKEILDSNSKLSSDLFGSVSEAISADRATYEREVAAQMSATPELLLASTEATAKVATLVNQLTNTDGAQLSAIRQIVAEGFTNTDQGVLDLTGAEAAGVLRGTLGGSTPVEEAVQGILALRRRRTSIGATRDPNNPSTDLDGDLRELELREKALRSLLIEGGRSGAFSLDSFRSAEETAEKNRHPQTERLLEILIEEIQGLRDEQAEGQKPPQVNVTPELSSNVP